jgi:hypothetical protein
MSSSHRGRAHGSYRPCHLARRVVDPGADPAGLTARARLEARPGARGKPPKEIEHLSGGRGNMRPA